MSAPHTPNDFKALISDPTSSLCGSFIDTLLKLPVVLYQQIAWLFNADGNFSRAAIQQIHQPGDLIFSAAPLGNDANRLLCDGSEVSQTTYPDLYAAIGAIYGTAGAGNFKLPDFRARFPCSIGSFPSGASVALGVPGGEEKHQLLEGEGPPHTHFIANTDVEPDAGIGGPVTLTAGNSLESDNQDTHGSSYRLKGSATLPTLGLTSKPADATAHNNIPPYFGVYTYICV